MPQEITLDLVRKEIRLWTGGGGGVVANKIIQATATDQDYNLISLPNVTGSPLMIWDESEDAFSSNKNFIVTGSEATTITLETSSSDTVVNFVTDSARTLADKGLFALRGKWDGTEVAQIAFMTGDDTVNKDNGEIRFLTAAAGTIVEALRIQSDLTMKAASLAGIGVRTVVVDANGVLSAP